jgi:hypothetical protein
LSIPVGVVITYKRYVAGVSVAAYLLRTYGSRQDMVPYVMMSESSKHRTLPMDDFRVLDALNVTGRQIEKPFLPQWDVWPADTEAWGTNRSGLVGTRASFGHGGAFQCVHHFINYVGKPWSDEDGCVGAASGRWNKEKSPASDTGGGRRRARGPGRVPDFFVESDALYSSTVRLDDLFAARSISSKQHWATEGPVTNVLEPDVDPRDRPADAGRR